LRVRSQGFDEAKYQLRGWFIVLASNTLLTAAATKISKSYSNQLAGNLPSTTVKFPAASNRMKV